MKIAVQLDFDGTITEEDVSFLLLDTYVGPRWREELKEYTSGRIAVGTFNRRVFGMMQASKQAMTDLVLTSPRVRVRPGFGELIDYCRRRGFKPVIVSNGLTFYIQAILGKLGIGGIEIHAAENRFLPGKVAVRYVGPDGSQREAGFKEAYTDLLVGQGYAIVYVGNGRSDIHPARRAIKVFATGDLLRVCREEGLACTPFDDLHEVIRGLEDLPAD